ncbi:IucC family-domain-containing protein [Panaeolus papilionaceus]|nr:IucC family-domain-containing protein [Panaeolus papilionaceus]
MSTQNVEHPSPHAINRAKFTTTARLLSCLVTESLVQAIYRPIKWDGISGVALILSDSPSPKDETISLHSILAVVPLHHPPIFKDGAFSSLGKPIGLLDPLDMFEFVYQVVESIPESGQTEHRKLLDTVWNDIRPFLADSTTDTPFLFSSTDVFTIWHKYAASSELGTDTENDIALELSSAIEWQASRLSPVVQAYSYDHPPTAPLFTSPSIDWEQSIVEGHPTHPMHKTRRFLAPLPNYRPGSYDLLHPMLRFVFVPRENLKITYDFEALTAPLLKAASDRAGRPFPEHLGHVVVPVHELQVTHVRAKFPDAIITPVEYSIPLLAQQSLRSVIVPDVYRDLHLKLGVGVKLTSAVRTISPESAYFGPRFSKQVVPALTMDKNIVTVARELASAVHVDPNGEVAKHCAAIVRECFELTSEERGERLIVCTSLVERGHLGTDGLVPSLIRVFELDTQEKRIEWLENFISVFLRAFLPPMLYNGVAFECHPQNCVARFDIKTKEIKGFIIRDFGGLKVHPETLKETTGVDLDVIDGHSVIASTLQEVYTRMYHTIIHNHFQQLIRVLDLHYNGIGWDVVRRQLRENIPSDHPLYAIWLSEDVKTFPGKCFMRMRMSSMYRFHLHGPFPNLIHYQGCDH